MKSFCSKEGGVATCNNESCILRHDCERYSKASPKGLRPFRGPVRDGKCVYYKPKDHKPESEDGNGV